MKNFALRLNIACALLVGIISFPANASEGRIDLSGTWQVLLDPEKMAADQTTQKWWDVCKPCQQPLESRNDGEWWAKYGGGFSL